MKTNHKNDEPVCRCRRSKHVCFRATEADVTEWQTIANALGCSLSVFMVNAINAGKALVGKGAA